MKKKLGFILSFLLLILFLTVIPIIFFNQFYLTRLAVIIATLCAYVFVFYRCVLWKDWRNQARDGKKKNRFVTFFKMYGLIVSALTAICMTVVMVVFFMHFDGHIQFNNL